MQAVILALALAWASTVGAQTPVTYVWKLLCPAGWTYGPYSTPDACREHRGVLAQTCEKPTVPGFITRGGKVTLGDVPNPDFVRMADVCQLSMNIRYCRCEYLAVRAQGRQTVLDVWQEGEAARAAAAPRPGPIKIGP